MKKSIKRFEDISLLLLATGGILNAAEAEKPMNVILIMADDFGYECIGANGSEYNTPNINRMAEQGIRFTNCHSNPLSTPSRVQLMTGKYNVKNYISFGQLDRKETTFGNIFQQAGYATCISGKWQLGKEKDSPQHFGFQQSCLWQHSAGAVDKDKNDTRYSTPIIDINGVTQEYPVGTFGPDVYNKFVLDFIRSHKDQPFFVYYPMCLTHCPFVSTPDSEVWDKLRSPSYKGKAVHFPDMVEYTDKMVGNVLKELTKQGLMDNTLVIFIGDNGTDSPIVTSLNGVPYPGGKGKTIDSGTHVPMIVHYPSGKVGVNNNLIDFTDFLPTICEAANISTKGVKELDGTSFLPQLEGKRSSVRDWVYCWYAPRQVYDEAAKVFARDKNYKLYRNGKMYNVLADFDEQNPLDLNSLTKDQQKVYKKLKKAIDRYQPYAEKKKKNK